MVDICRAAKRRGHRHRVYTKPVGSQHQIVPLNSELIVQNLLWNFFFCRGPANIAASWAKVFVGYRQSGKRVGRVSTRTGDFHAGSRAFHERRQRLDVVQKQSCKTLKAARFGGCLTIKSNRTQNTENAFIGDVLAAVMSFASFATWGYKDHVHRSS